MLRLAIFFCCSLIVLNLRGSSAHSQENGGTVCILHDAPTQCGAFCLSALHPLFDDNDKILNRLDVIEEYGKKAITKEEFDAKLKAVNSEVRNQLRSLQTTMEKQRTEMQKDFAAKLQSGLRDMQDQLKRDVLNIPEKFQKIGTRYFYIENNTKKTWAEAEIKCRQMGGYLAAIQNQDELNAITAKLRKDTDYWLGINDSASEGQYVSVASGRRAPFLKWKPDEPNDFDGAEECIHLYNGEMNDLFCSREHVFLCQADNKI
ncbi:accessory gland protein Acp29AB-like [Drosophila takahashii]|uniref:accessory gland protein Acp29AB-like n=1 Tax=Drosophila takahashii TaxID=29030 RepID=UPI001CF8EAFC|nr:accessory gland protein Acp29AB-like [Drosophila takahashii]